ncbi:MAG TPA: multicopper oxidase domain-containing protein [Gemmatimonadaceae bacterium]|nr:multicopper oxidase domain-containing protein [Gemmatimonadaceae bacterium]
MRVWSTVLLGCASALSGVAAPAPAGAPPPTASEPIVVNDNRHSAGTLRGNVLTVALEARRGIWHPEGPHGAGLAVEAWGEPGQPLRNPGPLLRVRVGTIVRAEIRNTLDKPLVVSGLSGKRGPKDTIVVAPGATRHAEFTASAAGTYFYTGVTDRRDSDDSQLNGAIVVDPADVAAPVADRVFVLSWWFTIDSASRTGLGQATMAINGLSWPHTERIDAVQGDSLHWRVLNLTGIDHPMHLHGFYFRVDAKGDPFADTLLAPADRRMAVTEILAPGQTMAMSWKASRPGNWIWHCHFAGHLSSHAALDMHSGKMDEHDLMAHGAEPPHQMFGLVLGIRVAPSGEPVYAAGPAPREMRIEMREKPKVYGEEPGYAFVLGGTADAANPDALPIPGPTLVLERGQPVAITIANRSREREAIHWHGIELESFPDGVPGWSGAGDHVLPSIAPGDSLTVRFTPPRAGTFMYHSHFNEAQQITSGLYGAIVVLDRGARFDTTTDRILLLSDGGPTTNVIRGPYPPKLLNGRAHPDPMELRAGTTYRIRMINISDGTPTLFVLAGADGKPVRWRAIAKDGADLPAHQATERPAVLMTDPGEIYDFALTLAATGSYTLTFGLPPFIKAPAGYEPTVMAVKVK